MKILIVGGGISGLTLAARLRQRGLRPTVVDHIGGYGDPGHAVTLWPRGSRVLHGLGLWNGFIRRSTPLRRHVLHDHEGRVLRVLDLERCVTPQVPRAAAHEDLLEILESANGGTPIDLDTSIAHLEPLGPVVGVRFSDGREAEFDLVVGADGMRSATRELAQLRAHTRPLDWRIWWWWAPYGTVPYDELHEYWGVRVLLSAYPTRDRVSCVAAVAGNFEGPEPDFLGRLRPGDGPVHCGDMMDITVPQWIRGRVILIGDAASGMPAATGIGASVAMESASVLDDELYRAEHADIDRALVAFLLRRRAPVEAAHRRARALVELMMWDSCAARQVRNIGIRYVPRPWIRHCFARWDDVQI
ncbi:FAD-dependent monooxygenase [Nocardia sp. CDC159]|uniref:FAD-dependent monooxygenase n=1 Tax=Nocardia pulmonis TaxID=2951408 RepID=A0A9X2ECC7_9NOCA|nr:MULTISPECIES: NAD(P)/FAD-dependent oxidoreductase [Nocardia]MCM6775618.1 FAD-dependent monooxygenase [Nocardia pulmonis]MCM6787648.1 FAD-dependent monooxygenase [Nocardia sp. CDC159]